MRLPITCLSSQVCVCVCGVCVCGERLCAVPLLYLAGGDSPCVWCVCVCVCMRDTLCVASLLPDWGVPQLVLIGVCHLIAFEWSVMYSLLCVFAWRLPKVRCVLVVFE